MAAEVFIHKMSEHMEMARIIRWLVKEGDAVEQFQIIMEVETDKATAELEAPSSGILKGVRSGAVDGAEVKVGETLAYIAGKDETVPQLPPLGDASPGAAVAPPPPQPAERGREEAEGVRATPVARRVAKELGIDLSLVKGTGPLGRIKEEDVRAFTASTKETATPPPVQSEAWVELTTAQRLTGQRMAASVQNAPQFALSLRADMTNALWLRDALHDRAISETGDRLSVTSILAKAVAEALARHPRANASFEDGRVRLYPQINIGIAIGTESGLTVAVVRETKAKSVFQISHEIKTFQEKAAQKHLQPGDLEGGTFTISNLGMYGIEQFNAILNPPQSAILAVGSVVKTPLSLPDDRVVVKPMVSLTLTVDHRVLDGMQGAQFLNEVKDLLEKPFFML